MVECTSVYSVANSWQNFPASPAEKFGRSGKKLGSIHTNLLLLKTSRLNEKIFSLSVCKENDFS